MSSKQTQPNKQPTTTPSDTNRTFSTPPVTQVGDDRYPGSFFCIPGLPTPGKTTWSINP